MKNNASQKVDDGNEYITKSILKFELEEAFEKFAQFLEGKFSGIYKRLDTIESTMALKTETATKAETATKQDILHIRDNFVPNYKHEELSLRVYKLEKNSNA